MCHYCGCRDMPLLRDYVAEHERAVNLGGAAVRALDRGDSGRAGELLAAMGEELRSHWRGEEDGLFAVLGQDELYAEHIAKEEDGLFPASLTALGGEEWDAAMAAWQEAHPNRRLIADAHNNDPVADR